MAKHGQSFTHLSRRETQIMETLFAQGEATVEEVRRAIDDEPSYDSVRAILRILETKGFVTRRKEGRKHVCQPTESMYRAKRAATRHLLDTFFRGATPTAVSTLIEVAEPRLSDDELDELAALIEAARSKRRRKEGRR